MNNKYTLIIDGSYFLYRALYVNPGVIRNNEILYSEKEVAVYIRKLAIDLAYQIRLFDGLVNDVVWTVDSRSWRKDIFPESDYKGNRKKNKKINWDNFKKASNIFTDIIENLGAHVSKVDGAEADDLVYAWSINKDNAIIFSGDKDLIQLIDNFTIFYSPVHSKIYSDFNFNDWLESNDEDEDVDIFSALKIDNSKHAFKGIIKNNNLDVIPVNSDLFRLKKIITGDKGDNVPPAYWKKVNNRTFGISEAKADKIIERFIGDDEFNYLSLYNEDDLAKLASIIIQVMNVRDKVLSDIVKNLKTNMSLMILDNRSIPNNIVDDMFSLVEESIETKKINIKDFYHMNTMLKDTPYVNQNDDTISSVFDGDDDLDDFSFIVD